MTGCQLVHPASSLTGRVNRDSKSGIVFFLLEIIFSLQKPYYVQLGLITIITPLRNDYPSHQATADNQFIKIKIASASTG